MTVSLDRKIEALELPFRSESEWTAADIAEHHRLTHKLITQVGSYTDIEDGIDNCPSVTARTRKHKGIQINYDNAQRDKAIRYDFVYGGMTVSELQEKWKLSQPQISRAVGGMREAKNRQARWKINNRRA